MGGCTLTELYVHGTCCKLNLVNLYQNLRRQLIPFAFHLAFD